MIGFRSLRMFCATPEGGAGIAQGLQRVPWFLRYGNVFRALQTVHDLTTEIVIEAGKLAKSGP